MGEIYLEIKTAEEQEIKEENDYIPGENQYKKAMKLYLPLPQFIALTIWKFILKNLFNKENVRGCCGDFHRNDG